MQLTTCKALHGNPACGGCSNQGQGGNCIMCPLYHPNPRLFPSACTPTLSPGCSAHTGLHVPASQVVDQKLSGQSCAGGRGQNPLPLYLTSVSKRTICRPLDFKEYQFSVLSIASSNTRTHAHDAQMVPPGRTVGADGLMGQAAGLSVWGKGCGG